MYNYGTGCGYNYGGKNVDTTTFLPLCSMFFLKVVTMSLFSLYVFR